MNNDFKHSDKRMQEKLEGFRIPAPDGAWTGIESAIGNKKSNFRRFFLWLLLLLIGGSTLGILTFNSFHSDEKNGLLNTTTLPSEINVRSKDEERLKLNTNSDHSIHTSIQENIASENHDKSASFSSASKAAFPLNSAGNKNEVALHSDTKLQSTGGDSNNSLGKNASGLGDSNLSAKKPKKNSNLPLLSGIHINDDNDKLAVDQKGNDVKSKSEVSANDESSWSLFATSILTSKPVSPLMISGPNGLQPTRLGSPSKIRGAWSLEAGLSISSFNKAASGTDSVDLNFINNSYTKSIGQGGFLRANYQPFRYVSFHSGLEFDQEQATQEFSTYTTVTSTQWDTVGYYFDSITQTQVPILDTIQVTSQVETKNSITNSVSQLNIPIGVMFHVPLGVRSELGINLTGLVGIRTKSTGATLLNESGSTIDAASAYRSVNFAARVAIRYSYCLNEHHTVYAEPHFGLGINNRSNAALPFATRFRNSGVCFGYRYNF